MTKSMSLKTSSTISSVEKGIDILFALRNESNKSIRDLSDELEITKSVLHRTLKTLEIKGMVRKDPITERYSLGYKILDLAESLRKDMLIRNIAYEYLKELRDRVKDTTQLAILDNDEILVIETLDGINDLRLFSRPGKRYPITYGNFGKVLLSQFSSREMELLIKQNPLQKYASESILDTQKYIEKVEEIKYTKVASGMNDPIEGAYSLASPITNSNGEIIAVIAISGVIRMNMEKVMKEFEIILKKYAMLISEKF